MPDQTAGTAPVRPVVEVSGIVKRYPGVTALGGVGLKVYPGEVLALIGENGAGKSTLMKILGGLVRPDEGTIQMDGNPVVIDSVTKSTSLGIALIHQELNVLDNIDVAGNIYLGREPTRWRFFGGGLIDRAKLRADAEAVLKRVGLPISVDTSLDRLSLAQRQMVEIAKALSLDARVLVMDEPTSSLTLSETERLLEIVGELREKGVAVIYISHRLSEVKQIADRVVALRDGQNAGELSRDEIEHDRMVRLMVGRDLQKFPSAPAGAPQPVRLQVKGLRTRRYPKREVDFEVRQGEVFCLAGLVGAGRSEVAQAIFGVDPPLAGQVFIDAAELTLGKPPRAIAAGIGLVPEDRRAVGLIVEWSIRENISLPWLKILSSIGWINAGREAVVAGEQSQSMGVKTPTIEAAVSNLSGGNQQKVVLGKWLVEPPKLLILDEPTRGVDVGAKAEIYELMRGLTSKGVSILMISSDMEEVLGVSDRIAVMHEGAIMGTVDRAAATEEKIVNLAVGAVEAA